MYSIFGMNGTALPVALERWILDGRVFIVQHAAVRHASVNVAHDA